MAPEERHNPYYCEQWEHSLQVLQGYHVQAVQPFAYAEGREEAGDELKVEDAIDGAVSSLVAVDGLVELVERRRYQLCVQDERVCRAGGEAHVEEDYGHEEGKHGHVYGQEVVQPSLARVLTPHAHDRIGVYGGCPARQTLAADVTLPT